MILLDTNALVWLEANHRRAQPLKKVKGRLFVSPVSLLEVQFLLELGRIRLKPGLSVSTLTDDERWSVDEPPAREWFEEALPLAWTRDPFDRIIVAHALVRGWRLATADRVILEHMDPRYAIEL